MPVTADEVIFQSLSEEEVKECIEISKNISTYVIDRSNLHGRDYLERFVNVLQGELAEKMVIKWLQKNNRYVRSAVDKNSKKPDLGHDIIVKNLKGLEVKCSIKSSLSVFKGIDDILTNFTLATEERELRTINIQVYFWLDIYGKFNGQGNRHSLLNTNNAAIISWSTHKQLNNFKNYATERRMAPKQKLNELNSLGELLRFLS